MGRETTKVWDRNIGNKKWDETTYRKKTTESDKGTDSKAGRGKNKRVSRGAEGRPKSDDESVMWLQRKPDPSHAKRIRRRSLPI